MAGGAARPERGLARLPPVGLYAVRATGIGERLLDHPLVNGLFDGAIAPEYAPDATSFMPTMIKARSRQTAKEIDLHVYEGQSFDANLGAWTM